MSCSPGAVRWKLNERKGDAREGDACIGRLSLSLERLCLRGFSSFVFFFRRSHSRLSALSLSLSRARASLFLLFYHQKLKKKTFPLPLPLPLLLLLNTHSYAEANQRLDYRFDAKAVAQVKARFLSLARVVCIKEFMSGWFHGAHPDTIGRGNVEDFVAYGFYTRTKADLPREQRDAIEAFVREVEKRWGVTFAAGRNPALRFMAHLWEPLRVIHKPLALHAACEAATLASHAALWCAGFRKHHVAGFDYWYREPVVAAPEAAAAKASTTATAAAAAAAPSAAPSAAAAAPSAAAAFSAPGSDVSSSDVDDISRSPSDESSGGEAAARASSASEGEEAAAAARANDAARASSSSSQQQQQRASLNSSNGNGNGLWRRGDSFSSLAGRSPLRSRRNTAGAAEVSTSSAAAAADTAADADASAAASAAAAAAASAPSTSSPAAAAAEDLPSSSSSSSSSTATKTNKRPVFFVHGVGFGLVPYLGLIALVARAAGRDRPLVLLEVPHVSLRFRSRRAQPVDDVAAAAVAVLARHGHDDAAFVAHSYGTFCVSRICQLHRRAVAAALLVDPVCCLTCYPHLLFNFVYKIPSMAAALAGGAAGALNVARFLFSRDLTIAETFCRRVSDLMVFFFFPTFFDFFF